MNVAVTDSATDKAAQYQAVPGPRIGTTPSTDTEITQRTATSSITITPAANHNLPPPPEGVVDAVCVRIEDKGVVETQWGNKHKISIVWQINALKENGERFEVAKWYTASTYAKSNLRKDLASWRGRDLTADEERQAFNTDTLVGLPCRLELIHVPGNDGDMYARVQSVLPPSETSRFGVKEAGE
jgi:hypothetical protein